MNLGYLFWTRKNGFAAILFTMEVSPQQFADNVFPAIRSWMVRIFWKYFWKKVLKQFFRSFCDVTLACEGQTIRAHRVVLCACSTYFDSILTNRYTDKDPIVIMKGCKFDDIRCLIEFMYKGEINVEHVSCQFSFFNLKNSTFELKKICLRFSLFRNNLHHCCEQPKNYESKV